MAEKKATPIAVCAKCGNYTYDVSHIDTRCNKRFLLKRCKGTYRSALAPREWRECDSCKATGQRASGKCEDCAGYGWHFKRNKY